MHSSSTARADRVAKRTLFRDERVPEYWIVDLDARAFERSTPAGASTPLTIDLPAYFERVLDS